MNKLQLIDAGKLNNLLNAFEQDRKEKRVLEGILDPNLHELRESYKDMTNKRKNIDEKEAGVVQFLKKRTKYKDAKKENTVIDNDDDDNDGENPRTKQKIKDSVKSEKIINNFLKKENITFSSINKTDFVYDLSHLNTKHFNLTDDQHVRGLKRLKARNFPASYIQNKILKKMYKNIDNYPSTSGTITPRRNAASLLPSSSSSTPLSSAYLDTIKNRRGKK